MSVCPCIVKLLFRVCILYSSPISAAIIEASPSGHATVTSFLSLYDRVLPPISVVKV